MFYKLGVRKKEVQGKFFRPKLNPYKTPEFNDENICWCYEDNFRMNVDIDKDHWD